MNDKIFSLSKCLAANRVTLFEPFRSARTTIPILLPTSRKYGAHESWALVCCVCVRRAIAAEHMQIDSRRIRYQIRSICICVLNSLMPEVQSNGIHWIINVPLHTKTFVTHFFYAQYMKHSANGNRKHRRTNCRRNNDCNNNFPCLATCTFWVKWLSRAMEKSS